MSIGRRWVAACALVGTLCAASPKVAAPEISSAWSRATAPGQTTGAVYLTITSAYDNSLVGLSSPDAKSAMLHRTTHTGGMSSMEAMDGLALPRGKPAVLAPHGLHIMLEGLKAPLMAGGRVTLTLNFANSANVTVTVPVLPIGASGPGHAHE